MKREHLLILGMAQAALLSGCIDDAYDLSDIDTTTQLRVDNLVVPVNIDAVTLNDVIKLEEDNNFKVISLGGKDVYAFTRRGDFNSDPIHVSRVWADGPELESSTGLLIGSPYSGAQYDYRYPIEDMNPVPFTFEFRNVDEAIREVESAETLPVHFDITLDVPEISGMVSSIGFENLEFQFPKNLTAESSSGTYDPKSGILKVPRLTGTMKDMKIRVTATGIDFEAGGAKLDYDTHSFTYEDTFHLLGGDLLLTMKSGVAEERVNFKVHYTISEIEATHFTGCLQDNIEGVELESVDLADIPTFLQQEETNLLLENPQLYLQVNNPVMEYHLYCETGIELTSIRRDGSRSTYHLDEGSVKIGDEGSSDIFNFCLSPYMPEYPQAEFARGLRHLKFTGMKEALGNGPIPERLEFELEDPQVPLQHVENFPLGTDLPKAKGEWEFLAPLNLSAGSVIVYTGEEVGWASEDLDALTIETLEVSATVTSDLPCEVYVTAEPVDSEGSVINGVEIEGGLVPPHATDYRLDLKMTGSVTHLDGIRYKAFLKAEENTGDITPGMNVNIKGGSII